MAKNLISGDTTTINENGNDIAVELNQEYKDTVDSVGSADSLETTDKTSLVSAINEIYDDLYFKDGDTITFSGDTPLWTGHVTSGLRNIRFTIPVGKSLDNINSITINTMVLNIRTTSGNYTPAGSTNFLSGYTITPYLHKEINAISILIVSSTNFPNATNNTPCAVSPMNMSITFNA